MDSSRHYEDVPRDWGSLMQQVQQWKPWDQHAFFSPLRRMIDMLNEAEGQHTQLQEQNRQKTVAYSMARTLNAYEKNVHEPFHALRDQIMMSTHGLLCNVLQCEPTMEWIPAEQARYPAPPTSSAGGELLRTIGIRLQQSHVAHKYLEEAIIDVQDSYESNNGRGRTRAAEHVSRVLAIYERELEDYTLHERNAILHNIFEKIHQRLGTMPSIDITLKEPWERVDELHTCPIDSTIGRYVRTRLQQLGPPR